MYGSFSIERKLLQWLVSQQTEKLQGCCSKIVYKGRKLCPNKKKHKEIHTTNTHKP